MSNLNPIDLLPVNTPFNDDKPPSEISFYKNVLKNLLPDVLDMQNEGIPIDLNKVKEIEELTSNIIEKVENDLSNNPIIQEYLNNVVYKNIDKELEGKDRTYKDYLTKFCKDNSVLRSYVINYYLDTHGLSEDKLDNWKIKDIKQYGAIKDIELFRLIADKKQTSEKLNENEFIQEAMMSLAEYKASLYNKTLESKRELQKQKYKFNPKSPTQIRNLMKYLGYESEGLTKKGQEQWNRDNLVKLKTLIEQELEDVT